jgi:hypothetical protein
LSWQKALFFGAFCRFLLFLRLFPNKRLVRLFSPFLQAAKKAMNAMKAGGNNAKFFWIGATLLMTESFCSLDSRFRGNDRKGTHVHFVYRSVDGMT